MLPLLQARILGFGCFSTNQCLGCKSSVRLGTLYFQIIISKKRVCFLCSVGHPPVGPFERQNIIISRFKYIIFILFSIAVAKDREIYSKTGIQMQCIC